MKQFTPFRLVWNKQQLLCNGITVCFCLLLFFPLCLFSQAPAIQWNKTLGGSLKDVAQVIKQTADGGFILGGYSLSDASGDKTENSKGLTDYWVAKLDPNGNKLWDKTIGGAGDDYLNSLQQTADKGYILGGYSSSNISGDKSENSKGGDDYWVVRLDANGNILWDKTIGGSNGDDYLFSLQQTADNGYILGGISSSNISGDKSENSKGVADYWVVKLDNNGNKIWDKTIGGNSFDILYSLQQTADNGYILGGYSQSNISGDKSENSKGGDDYWIVKLDVNGNKIWDKTIGGNDFDALYSIKQTIDHGYILGGYSQSNISGDKSENSKGGPDYWVVKLDASGNKIWDKTIGGNNSDNLTSVQQTIDNGYILGGSSYSGISGDKTGNSKGGPDYWVVKLGATGTKLWDKTIGGNNFDALSGLQQTADNGYILGGGSASNISGDKTENSKGDFDYWVVKLEADNYCQFSSLLVTIPDAYTITSGASANTVYICYQPASSITLTASASAGNTPYNYSWSTTPTQTTQQVTVSPAVEGAYDFTVTVTDASGCTAEFTKTIEAIKICSGQNNNKVMICHIFRNGSSQLSVLPGAVADHLAHGDQLGSCPADPNETGIAARTPVTNEVLMKGFKIYPNPATNFLDVQWTTTNKSQTTIRILNAEGRVVKTLTTKGAVNNQRISLDGLAKGIYMVVLKAGSDQQVSKFVIQ